MREGLAAICAAIIVVLAGTGAVAKDTTVQIRDNFYAKPFVVIVVGETITWKNKGSIGHTVVSYDGTFDSSPSTTDDCAPLLGSADCLQPDDEFARTFLQPGTYDYYCKVANHADPGVRPDPQVSDGDEQPCGMCAQVVVLEDNEAPAPTRSARPSPSSTRSASPSPSPTPTGSETGDPLDPTPGDPSASPTTDPVADGGGPPVGLVLPAIAILGGAGWFVWRRYIAI